MGANCCRSDDGGSCRCNYRYSQTICVKWVPSCCNTCCNACCPACLSLPDLQAFNVVPGKENEWLTPDRFANHLFNDIELRRIVPIQSPSTGTPKALAGSIKHTNPLAGADGAAAEGEGPLNSRGSPRRTSSEVIADEAPDPYGRDPFVALVMIDLQKDDNEWLDRNPDHVSLFMSTDGGPSSAMQLENSCGHGGDPFKCPFFFIIDRSQTTLKIVLRKNPWGEMKRVFGEGHKLHEWNIMIDDAQITGGGGASGASGEWSTIESQLCAESKNVAAPTVYIGEGKSKVQLKCKQSRVSNGEPASVNVCVKYERLRGTIDRGNAMGPGYLAVYQHADRPEHRLPTHWVCSHDNVFVRQPDDKMESQMVDYVAGKMGANFDRVAATRDLMGASHGLDHVAAAGLHASARTVNTSISVNMPSILATQAMFETHLHLEAIPGETLEAREQRKAAVTWMYFLSARLEHVEYKVGDSNSSEPTISGTWQDGGSHGTLCGLVVPVDMWATKMKPMPNDQLLRDGEAAEGDTAEGIDPFWDVVSSSFVVTDPSLRKDDGTFKMKLPMVSTYHPGLYTIRMLKDDASYGMGNLFYLKPGTQCIVFDCDGTLTTGDQEVVTQFICTATYDPERFMAAATMVRFWAAKGYQIVYLSGRQGTMYNWTMSWLIRHGFPPGPIHLTRTSLPTLPTYSSVGKFKCDYMKGLESKGLKIYAAYGNTKTDIKAYLEPIEEWSASGYHYHMAMIYNEPDATTYTPYLSLDWGAPFWGYDN